MEVSMRRLKSILLATDFSDNATHALRKAALLAEHHGACLVRTLAQAEKQGADLIVVGKHGASALLPWPRR
jgi:nucleotide-binding universal stress UspA family protein